VATLELVVGAKPPASLTRDGDDRVGREGGSGKKGTVGERTVPLLLKQIASGNQDDLQLSRGLGLAREALFYRTFRSALPDGVVPDVYYAAGDMSSGAKAVLMHDLSDRAVDSAVFFGPGNPNSWDRDLDGPRRKAELAARSPITSRDVALATFCAATKMHAAFWKRQDLLEPDKFWLRGQTWLLGNSRETWEASQNFIRDAWNKINHGSGSQSEASSSVGTAIRWDPNLRAAVQRAVEGISWERQLERLHVDSEWTLVHGDFWPGNVLWMVDDRSVRLVDWEMCGLGSGPQDLGQYILSNMDPHERRGCERELVEAYHNELQRSGVDVTWDYCWNEYRIGGLERWLWFLVYFLGDDKYAGWVQFFHDQMSSFMTDHGLTADDVVQVRP
jgi:hypothetical protein